MLSLRDALADVERSDIRIAITGAGGWLGRELTDLLCDSWGSDALDRTLLLARSTRKVRLTSGREVPLIALEDARLAQFQPTHIVHLAFLTRDRVDHVPRAEYVAANRALTRAASSLLELESVEGFMFTSSGAVLAPDLGTDGDLYGQLKRSDESIFPELAAQSGKSCVTARVWSVSGANMQKIERFALGSLISQAISGGPLMVQATRPVFRRYVDAGEFLALALLELFDGRNAVIDSAGERIEMSELAARVAANLCPDARINRPVVSCDDADDYTADPVSMLGSAARHGVEFMNLDQQIVRTASGIRGGQQP